MIDNELLQEISLDEKTVVITGVTGFLGKVFLVRLLKLFPKVKKIVLLIRGASPWLAEQRMDAEIFDTELFKVFFSSMNQEQIDSIKSKFVVCGGDTKNYFLGIGGDLHLLNIKPDFVINSAASVNFIEPLDQALDSNFHAVENILEFCEITGAKLLHISTCYVNGRKTGSIGEHTDFTDHAIFSHVPVVNGQPDVKKIVSILKAKIDYLKSLYKDDEESLKTALTSEAQKTAQFYGWFDIYTFTKWLAEQLIVSQSKVDFRILRPSIIESTHQFPFPGWIEGFKVADPLIHFGGNGQVRFFPGKKTSILDIIPVDKVADAMILMLFSFSISKSYGQKVYQVCSGSENPLFLSKMTDFALAGYQRRKILIPFFLPTIVFQVMTRVLFLLTQILSWGLHLFGLKKHSEKWTFKVKMIRKLLKLAKIYQSYTSIQCIFQNEQLLTLNDYFVKNFNLNELDISMKNLEWEDYIVKIHINGLKRFVISKSERLN